MAQQSSPSRSLAKKTGMTDSSRMVRCAELPPSARRLLCLTRLFIAAGLDYRRVEPSFSAVMPGCSRAVTILLCHLLLEASRHSARRLQVARPCHTAITDDEIHFLAALDLAQRHDPRLPSLLSGLYGNGAQEYGVALAAVLAATQRLGEALLQEGVRVEAGHLLPVGSLPAVH